MSETEAKANFTNRDYTRTLSSIRADARKVSEALTRMEKDAEKLATGGHPAPAAAVGETVCAARVVMKNIRDVFRLEI